MLKTLIDFFLLISSDKKTITCNNILTFYQFITKKIIDIENQRPFIITNSLSQSNLKQSYNGNITNKDNEGFAIQTDEYINKTNRVMDKNIEIKKFQKEIISLFNDMIDFLYEENIIVLKEDKKNLLKNKINRKIKEKNVFLRSNSSYNLINDIKKVETRNYIIELINENKNNNNFTSFNFTIKNFIDFFNTKNKNKNRLIAEKFVVAINPIIKIYKNDKKLTYFKKVNKTTTRSLSRIPIIHIDNNDLYKAKISNEKKSNYKCRYKNRSININNTNTKLNNYIYKVNHSFNKKKNKFGFNNLILNKIKRKTEFHNKSKILKSNMNEQNNASHDTIQCQTLSNCNSFDNIHSNYKIENILNNNIKNKSTNINLSNKIKFKKNKSNSNKVIINEIKNFYSNSQIDYFKKNNNNNNKSSITTLYDNDLYDLNKNIKKNKNSDKNCILKFCNNEFDKNTKELNLLSDSKKEEELNEKYFGCFIF